MVIAVDFDGTIVEHKYPEIGREIPGAIDALKNLAQRNKVILWTVREGKRLEEAIEFCAKRGLTFYAANSDEPDMQWDGRGARKLRADVFIDDANLGGLPDWDMIYEMILTHQTFGDVLQSGAYAGGYHLQKEKKRSLFRRFVDRCRNARNNVGGGRYSRHW